MVFVDPNIAKTVAHMEGVREAVMAERDRIAARAEALFAPHDNPGGHEITKTDPVGTGIDALVNLEGPAPLSVEFGHWTKPAKGARATRHGGEETTFVEGLHILGRAIGQAGV